MYSSEWVSRSLKKTLQGLSVGSIAVFAFGLTLKLEAKEVVKIKLERERPRTSEFYVWVENVSSKPIKIESLKLEFLDKAQQPIKAAEIDPCANARPNEDCYSNQFTSEFGIEKFSKLESRKALRIATSSKTVYFGINNDPFYVRAHIFLKGSKEAVSDIIKIRDW